jgi:hypothetical protein
MPYTEYLRTPHWQAVRAAAIRVSHGRCGHCAKEVPFPSAFDVHHRRGQYESLGRERPEDVIALCRDCHRKCHPNWEDQRLRQGLAQLEDEKARDRAAIEYEDELARETVAAILEDRGITPEGYSEAGEAPR